MIYGREQTGVGWLQFSVFGFHFADVLKSFSNLNFYSPRPNNVLQKGSSWGEVQTDAYHARFPMLYSFNCYHKRVTAESTEYNVRTQKAQFKIDLLMADSSRFIQHVFTKPSQMLPGSFNFVVNLVVQPMTI